MTNVSRVEDPAERVFPFLTTNPYAIILDTADLPEDQRAAYEVLTLAKSPLTRRQRLGIRLSPFESVQRLFYAHKQFLDAELTGRTDQADFWWEETSSQWRALPEKDIAWTELAQHLGQNNAISRLCDPAQLRMKISRELLLDTHLALRNGFEAIGGYPRAKKHYEAALALADDAMLSDVERRDLDMQITRARIEECKSSGEWSEAIRLAKSLQNDAVTDDREVDGIYLKAIQEFVRQDDYVQAIDFAKDLNLWRPNKSSYQQDLMYLYQTGIETYKNQNRWKDAIRLAESRTKHKRGVAGYLEELVNLHFAAATSDIEASGDETEAGSRYRAKEIGQHVSTLEEFVKREPNCYPAYEAIAVLCHMQAVSLANGGRPSQALLAIEKAVTYKPDWEEARNSRARIESLLQSLLDQLSEVRQQLRQAGIHSDADRTLQRFRLSQILTSEGVNLFEEAERGTKPRDEFRNSKEQKQIQKNLENARPRWLWMCLDLQQPNDDWDEQARSLEAGLNLLAAEDVSDTSELITKWQEIVENYPELGLENIDPDAIVRLFSNQEATHSKAESREAIRDSSQSDTTRSTETSDEKAEEEHVPFLTPIASQQSSDKPYVPFEFWLYSWRGAGTKAAFVAGMFLLVAAASMTVIDSGKSSQRDQAYQTLIEAASKLDDKTAQTAVDQFRDANPFRRNDKRTDHVDRIASELDAWPKLRERNAAYTVLVEAVKSSDDKAAANAARDFLAAVEETDDPRTPQVRELLADAQEIPNRKIRDREYTKLVEALQADDLTAALLAAEKFLEAVTENRDDPRTPVVWSSYTQAFLDWMIEQDQDLDQVAKDRVEKYTMLTSDGHRRN